VALSGAIEAGGGRNGLLVTIRVEICVMSSNSAGRNGSLFVDRFSSLRLRSLMIAGGMYVSWLLPKRAAD
jgi:hypothetical protein